MSATQVLILAMTLLACCSATAQTDESAPSRAPVVYKCTGADGNVAFSDAPCPAASKAQQVDTSAALHTGSGGHTAEIAAAASSTDCQRSARQSAYGGTIDADIASSNSHIAEYRKRQGDLASMKAYASDGSGNLVDDPAAQSESAKLDAAIAKEQSFQRQVQADAAAKYETAAKACDAAAAKSAQAQQDKK